MGQWAIWWDEVKATEGGRLVPLRRCAAEPINAGVLDSEDFIYAVGVSIGVAARRHPEGDTFVYG